MSESEWVAYTPPPIKKPEFNGNLEFKIGIGGTSYKIINIISSEKPLFVMCDCENIFKYNIKYKEKYYNEEEEYDIIIYDFELILNGDTKTYWLNDIKNGKYEKYETNIIGNVNREGSTKEQNTQFLKGETFISYVFKEPITFKNIIDDCFD